MPAGGLRSRPWPRQGRWRLWQKTPTLEANGFFMLELTAKLGA